MGQVALPEMKRFGYPDSLSTDALAAGGTLGILIPPSVILVIYAILAEQNIAKLFVAAFIPGLLAAVGYMIAISVWMRLRPNATAVSARVPWSGRLGIIPFVLTDIIRVVLLALFPSITLWLVWLLY